MIKSTPGIIASSISSFPTQPTLTNLIGWYKADAGVTLNGSNVSALTEQTLSGRNYLQASATSQPLYVTNSKNGHPIIRFDGVNDFFDTGVSYTQSGTTTTCYWVFKRANNNNHAFSTGGGWQFLQDGTNRRVSETSVTRAATAGTWYIVCAVIKGTGTTGVDLYENGVLTSSTNQSMGAGYLDMRFFGQYAGGRYLAGDFAEYLWFNTAHNSTDIATNFSYLNGKWGVY